MSSIPDTTVAELFKEELLAASIGMLHPHIEGVWEVFIRRLEEKADE